MYAKVGATSTSIRLNKPSMQHSPTHWNSKNYEKKWPENASKRVDFSKFSYPGEGHIPSPAPHPCADSALRASLRLSQHFSNLAPPFQFLCTPLIVCENIIWDWKYIYLLCKDFFLSLLFQSENKNWYEPSRKTNRQRTKKPF